VCAEELGQQLAPVRPENWIIVTSRAKSLFAHLLDTACGLGADELTVLVRIAERIAAGRTIYGSMHLTGDEFLWSSLPRAA
jgi:hypothetical protein